MDKFNTDNVMHYATTYGLELLYALLIFVVGKWLAKSLSNMAKRAMTKSQVDKTLVSFAGNIVYAVLLVVVILAALGRLGIETTSFAAMIAAVGLAIGLSLQSSLSNLASGVMIIMLRPFKVGDFVEAAGVSGVISGINIFTTTLKTGDNKTVLIPNNGVISSTITNYSTEATRRIDMVFGIGYDDDMKKAKKILDKIVQADKRVLKDPAVKIAVSELADSSVNIIVRPWVKSADYWNVKFDITENVKDAFDKAGISIPYPQQDVHMHQTT